MSRTARRDGTPEHNRQSTKRGGTQRPQRGNNGRTDNKQSSRQSQRGTQAGQQPRKQRASEILVSQARPARRQHVAPRVEAEVGGESIRLQKVLAKAGVASRRHAEILIDQGRVEVNGKIVMVQGQRVNPNKDIVRVDGIRVNVNENLQYFVLNKPRGLHSTMHDDLGRPCVGDIISERIASGQRLFHVGRLDADTEGLLLLTNDGELANRLMHPKHEVSKTYLATVLGEANRSLVRQLCDGIELDDGPAKADFVQIVDVYQGKSLIRLELHEGRKHIVRRMLKAAGYPVQALVRTKLHTVQLGEQTPGTIRALNEMELASLYKAVGM